MAKKILVLWLLCIVAVSSSCIERPWNKPVPLNKIYAKARHLTIEKKYDEALEIVEQAIDRVLAKEGDEKDLVANDRAKPYYIKGNIYYISKQYDEAVSAFDQATRIDPNYAEAWLEGAFSLYQLGKDSQAAGYLDNAKQAYELKLNQVQMWEASQRITKTYETKLHIAIISGLLGYKDAAISQMQILQAAYPDLAHTDFWIEKIRSETLKDELMKFMASEPEADAAVTQKL